MEEKKQVMDEGLEKVTGGAGHPVQTANECLVCHSHAYILIAVEAGGVQHRQCTSCHNEYWYKG